MLTKNATLLKLFRLDGLFLDSIEDSDESIILKVRSPRIQAICPNCRGSTKRVHGRSIRTIKHMQCDGKLVFLQLMIRNFICSSCKQIFRETISGVGRKQTTEHYRRYVVPKVRDRSFRSVALEHQIGVSTLVAATRDLNTERGIVWPKGKFALGIDEHSFSGSDLVMTITDVTNHDVLALLRNTKQTTLRTFLNNIPKEIKGNMTAVCIDMHQGYKAVLEQEIPYVPIVVDQFHVIQHLNKELSSARLIFTSSKDPLPKRLFEKNREDLTVPEKKQLRRIFKDYPALDELWRVKEIVRGIYRLRDAEKAKERYQGLLDGLRGDRRPRFNRLYRTLKRWQKEILNYFDYRITNAYTEGVHTRIKLLKRISYGFRNKENYIAKMTLAFLPLAVLVEMAGTSTCLT